MGKLRKFFGNAEVVLRPLLVTIPLWFCALGAPAWAAGRVELELVTADRVPIMSQQQWMRRLAQAGVTNLRIRAARPLDKVGVEVRGTEAAPVYAVTGLITAGDELVLPGGRFRSGDAARAAQWLHDLARLGPQDRRPAKSAFGLDVVQFKQLHDVLAKPVGVPTQDSNRAEVVRTIARRLPLPVEVAPQVLRAAGEDKLVEELSGLSCGTALAYALRAPGLCLVPRVAAGGLSLEIVPAAPGVEAWPVGWKSEKPDREVLPTLYEFLNVQLDGVAVTKVLEAVGGRLKVPILLDHNAMARHGVDPDGVFVTLPQGRTTYSLVLRKVLFQARLKSEIRQDEAGRAFLWITTIKPL